MSYLDLTAMNAALKELYDGQVVEDMVYSKNPALALIPKKTDFGGKNKPIPIITGASQGRSSVFATAQSNQSPVQVEAFSLTRKKDYSLATIDNETMLASATDKMAFLEGAKIMIDGAFRAITLSLASAMYRSGTGSIGLIAAGGITSGVITLDDPTTVAQFEINMVLQANATDGGTPRAALGYVIAVNRTAGTVTVASSGLGGSAATPSGWQAADYLLVQGDNNAKISGFAAWVPSSAPSATSFYGVDRSVDTRLGGLRYDGSAQPMEEAVVDAASLAGREGASPDVLLTNYVSYSALEKSMGTKVQYVDLQGPGKIGFRGIRVNTPAGEIKVVPDRNCPGRRGYLLQMDTWQLASLGEAPRMLTYQDGIDVLRVYNADAGEVRVGYYANQATNAPGWNTNVTFGA